MVIAKKIKLIFFGTSEYSVMVLDTLKEAGYLPELIITTPDKPQGRGLVLTPPPVKIWAEKNKIKYIQPETLKDEKVVEDTTKIEPDLGVAVAYGKIIPKELINTPKHGILNLHASLLPKYRGSCPIENAILNDEKENGSTIIKIDEKMDHGPIISKVPVSVSDWPPKSFELGEILVKEGARELARIIPLWVEGKIKPEIQDESIATYTKKIAKEDGLIDLSGDPYENFLKIRAYDGWPNAYFFAERSGKKIRVIIKDAEFKNGELKIIRVIPESKKEMNYGDFLKGNR